MKKLLCVAVAVLAVAGMAAAADYEIPPGGQIPTTYTMQNGATSAANGNTINFHGGTVDVTCYVSWGTTTSKGAITFETASVATYAGTWAPLAVVTWGAHTTQAVWSLTGAKLNVVRARVSTASDGNGVTVTCRGRAY